MSGFCQNCNRVANGEYLCNPADPNSCVSCQKLSELENKIADIRSLLAGLEDERQRLKEQVNYSHDNLIHRLPPEIASCIFELCIPGDIMDLNLRTRNVSRYTICAPLILSAVSRRWRTIAHSTPRLWTTLPLCLQGPGSGSSVVLLVKEWINRAGELPLSINFCVVSGTQDFTDATIQIIATLNQYSYRWIQLRHEDSEGFLSNNPYYLNLPKLHPERLNVLSVTRLVLVNITFDWIHLTRLVVEEISYSDSFEALLRAPHLTQCSFGKFRNDDTPRLQDPIVHLGIQHLDLGPWCSHFLRHISCPSLKNLAFRTDCEIFQQGQITDFLGRSGCSLERLSSMHGGFFMTNIAQLCQGIPTLQHLYISIFTSQWEAPSRKSLFADLAEFSTADGRKDHWRLPSFRPLNLDSLIVTSDDWVTFPDIFGPPTSRDGHTLGSLTIAVINPQESRRFDSYLDCSIVEDTLGKILWVRGAGGKWKVQFGRAREDMIELEVDRYDTLST